MSLTNNLTAGLWLQQFGAADEPIARRMLEKFQFISGQEFSDNLTELTLRLFRPNDVAAFFVERQLQTTRAKLPRKMYKEQSTSLGRGMPRRLRATGAALAAVQSATNYAQDIGSEGIVASVLTQLCRGYQKRFVLHPSANEIRKRKVRHIVIVTDFIGSGTRTLRMLQSLWQVRSIRSWHSGRLVKFSIVAYSGTAGGIKKVKSHSVKPNVSVVCSCPTLANSFRPTERNEVIKLCVARSPDSSEPLGYKDTGALIAFAHSCPNNVPAIFHKSGTSLRTPWHALFPSRVTTEIARDQAFITKDQRDGLALETLKYGHIASSLAFTRSSQEQRNVIIVLAALRKGHRALDELVTVTGKSLSELAQSIEMSQVDNLLDINLRLTAQAFALLKSLNAPAQVPSIAQSVKTPYYPTSLRAPN